jgi:BirA family biotin operon repressor/biotin-[acetyl-CoA-carboxylase] ligase
MIGRKIIYKETLDSTNNYAAILLSRGELAHGTVIMAGEQTAGRGQRGATWTAEPHKNLIFTCFLQYDNLSVEKQEAITQAVSLALIALLREKGVEAAIKWPNDIIANNRKMAGILIENQLERDRVKNSIIGIGLNVNQQNFEGFDATSLLNESADLTENNIFDVQSIGLLLIEQLNFYLGRIAVSDFAGLKRQYLDNLWRKDEQHWFEDQNGAFEGIIRGTDIQGRLLVEDASGTRSFDLKEISFKMRNTPGA